MKKLLILFVVLNILGAFGLLKQWLQGGIYQVIEIVDEVYLCGDDLIGERISADSYQLDLLPYKKDKFFLIIFKSKYLLNKSEEAMTSSFSDEVYFDKKFNSNDYELIREGYTIDKISVNDELELNDVFAEFKVNAPFDKNASHLFYAEYYQQTYTNRFTAFFCKYPGLKQEQNSCQTKVFNGDFKDQLLKDYSYSSCKGIEKSANGIGFKIIEHLDEQKIRLKEYKNKRSEKEFKALFEKEDEVKTLKIIIENNK
jgi:hypothetical protein